MKRIIPGIAILVLLLPGLLRAQERLRLSLTEATELALKQNPEVRAARNAAEAARGRFWRGVSPPPPSVTLGYDYVPSGGGLGAFGERWLEVSQSIEFPTTILLRGSGLSSGIDAAEGEYRAVERGVRARTAIAYNNVLAHREKIQLAGENLAIAEDFMRKAEVRKNVGEGTNLELLTARVQRTQAASGVEIAVNDHSLARGELATLLGARGEGSAERLDLSDSLRYRSLRTTLEEATAAAESENPLLAVARSRLEIASSERSVAWSSFLPSLSASYAWQTVGSNGNLYGVKLGASVPLWFLLDQKGRIEEASANLSAAQEELVSARNVVEFSVRSAYLEMKNSERQVILHQTEIVPQAEEVYRAARASYEAGEAGYMEFLQARQTLVAARAASIDALFSYNAALARLEQAVGRSIE